MKKKLIYTAIICASFLIIVSVVAKPSQTRNKQEVIQSIEKKKPLETTKAEVLTDKQDITPKDQLFNVISVTDGDTIKVDINGKTETLRLIGMDTPETVDPRKPVQCFAVAASNKAKEILSDKKVRLEADPTQGELDKYHRLLRYVFLEDGTFYNKYMIKSGYAHEYTYQSNPYKYQTDFKEAEKAARENNLGFWNAKTCNGDTVKPADMQSTSITPATSAIDEPWVKKSKTNICHEKGMSAYYNKTKNYTPFNTIDDCLKSGGRLPLK